MTMGGEVDDGAEVLVDIEIAWPDDWHVHLRDDEMLAAVVPHSARWFRNALVMPNLVPPVSTVAQAVAYRKRIQALVAGDGPSLFNPLMALYLNDDLDIDDLVAGFKQGDIAAVKYYPAGATTNSEYGSTSMLDLIDRFEALAEHQIPVAVHAESTDPGVDIYDRERLFLEHELAPLMDKVNGLRITVEHISTSAGIEFVKGHDNMAGTITPHHLACDRSDLLANGLRPDLYCKPILNSPQDRVALVEAATSGDSRFFLGTDSAPHPSTHKYRETASAGVFNAPYAIPVVAEVFYQAGSVNQLSRFLSLNGCAHYRCEPPTETLRLRRRNDLGQPPVGQVVTESGQTVTIFGVDAARRWDLSHNR